MTTTTLKDARMELKTTSNAKDLLTQAALLDGMDLSAFVLSSAIEKARKVLASHASLSLSLAGQKRLVALLHAQPEPTDAMKALMALPDFPTKS